MENGSEPDDDTNFESYAITADSPHFGQTKFFVIYPALQGGKKVNNHVLQTANGKWNETAGTARCILNFDFAKKRYMQRLRLYPEFQFCPKKIHAAPPPVS